MRTDFLLLGATGATGRLIARQLARSGASVTLAGRDTARLHAVAADLGATGSVRLQTLDLDDPSSLPALAASARVLVNTVGPFGRLAPSVTAACLAAGTAYVDLANERAAVRALLDRDGEAREQGATLVTGAGFGPAATEAPLLALLQRTDAAPEPGLRPAAVVLASAASSAYDTTGVRTTVAEATAEGAAVYRDGRLVHQPLGSGATTLAFAGATRPVIPVPVGDLEAAHRLTGAPEITAYAVPRGTAAPDGRSHGHAEIRDQDGRVHRAGLSTGEAFAFTAALAAATATRLLDGPPPGAWTAARLLGAEAVAALPGTAIELAR